MYIKMTHQIFKKNIPIKILFDLLDKVCDINDKYYLINNYIFKKIVYHQYQEDFLNNIMPYYHNSKMFYVNRTFTYNSFVNIVRQICKYNEIPYVNKIKYNESKYDITYYIYK